MNSIHILVIACPAQGHINPSLQLSKCLARAGFHVTFATTVNGLRLIRTFPTLPRLSFSSFSTGFDDGVKPTDDPRHVADEFKRVGSKSLADLITSLSNQGHPISLLIYTLVLPWAAHVARDFHVPSAFLCIHSATSFAIYNRFFNGHNGLYNKSSTPSCVELPGLPSFGLEDLPTFLLPTSPHYFALPTFEEHIKALEMTGPTPPIVLLNTFHGLEVPAIATVVSASTSMKVLPIGPLIPSAFYNKDELSDTSYGCDLFESSDEYLTWLDSQAEKSVVYVSFGTMGSMTRKHSIEILHGLLETGRPYLWAIPPPTPNKVAVVEEAEAAVEEIMTKKEKGMVVRWCSQVKVLNHRGVGCMVTHGGWNSTLECVVAGVGMVVCPQIADQTTNGKMVEEVWRTGVRAKAVEREEIRRCVEVVMGDGERGVEMRRNALEWRNRALLALQHGGSSDINLKLFLESLA